MNNKKDKMTLRESFTVYKRCLKLIGKADRGCVKYDAINQLIWEIIEYINIFFAAKIIDLISNGADFSSTLILAAVICGANVLLQALQNFLPLMDKSRSYSRQKELHRILSDKVMNMDYTRVEDPDTHIAFNKASQQITHGGTGLPAVEGSTVNLIFAALNFIIGLIMLAPLAFSLPVETGGFAGFIQSPLGFIATIIIVAILEFIKATFVNNKVFSALDTILQDPEVNQARRVRSFLDGFILGNYRSGKDIRVYSEQKMLLNRFDCCIDTEIGSYVKGFKKMLLPNSIWQLINILTRVIMYGFAVSRALTGMFTAGEVIAFVMYFSRIQNGVSEMSDSIGRLKSTPVFCKQIFDFLDIPDEKYKGTIPTEKRDDNEYEFEFKHVYFRYPNSDNYVLRDINLKWRIGEKMALVGRNGSGKSTLVKLLCRLYDPTEGEITLNGINIKKYDYNEYMALFSVVFQDSKLFSFSIAENVAASTEYDAKRVEDCVRRAGLSGRLDELPDGIDTCLYKDFNEKGVEISGGEAQKLCLARAIYKGSPFIVLDEPTAALDPISEHDIYTKFSAIVGSRTAIYISHRLSSCRFCDDITVLDGGKIAERGSHENLIADGGVYAGMWSAQAEYYKNTAGELFA